MKKWFISGIVATSVMVGTVLPAFANAVFPDGQTGHPIGAYSNPGSVQGQDQRSTTGTDAKTTHDGYEEFI